MSFVMRGATLIERVNRILTLPHPIWTKLSRVHVHKNVLSV
jgi:hypothetical protein